jgi:tetratricopeptide (TPR) repeat protein
MSFLARIFNPKKSSTKVKFRREGDAARDAKRWNEAAANYSAYLTLAPDDNKIFVQCGNCLKEAGKLEQSLAAYDSAIALDDADSDVFLQRGHLLKLMGRPQAEPARESSVRRTIGAAKRWLSDRGGTVTADYSGIVRTHNARSVGG